MQNTSKEKEIAPSDNKEVQYDTELEDNLQTAINEDDAETVKSLLEPLNDPAGFINNPQVALLNHAATNGSATTASPEAGEEQQPEQIDVRIHHDRPSSLENVSMSASTEVDDDERPSTGVA